MRQRHKVNGTRRKALFGVAGLVLGGGGLVAINVGANASDSSEPSAGGVVCPGVEDRLGDVPQPASAEVQRNLELMKRDMEAADTRLSSEQGVSSRTVLDPLRSKRAAILERIEIAVERAGAERPKDLQSLATCTAAGTGAATKTPGGNGQQSPQQPPATGTPQPSGGPAPEDFVDITRAQPNVQPVRNGGAASKGAFRTRCGVNKAGRFNSDNVIVAPGVSNGAHHTHDYVGAVGVDAFTDDDALAASRTTCTNGDRSTYYWPVLRDRDGVQESDADKQGGGAEGNTGKILTPVRVSLEFIGNPNSKVTAMPRFLRIITGDAKANANGGANANARFTCTGFENKVELRDKYPVCPQGSKLMRVSKFQNCWDGKNTDSANHRSHVAFADQRGVCPAGFRPIPQLVQRVTYNGLAGSTAFAIDSFPESLHKPITDHGDFINAMPKKLMKKAVKCINSGRRCG
ncbi:DUF1996 domain-containing protein [Streptomyces sp. NPDC048636]|uniref:DUF1996 domain-containing protein n=1 Tax=Streptomyces sp. NPDC048636 TaxID=3155762 RepID=UPI0034169C0C